MHTLGDAPAPNDLVGLLLACHQRIRSFARLAFTLGVRLDLDAAEVADAASRCWRYFHDALPLHVLDEEQSLWPRLAGRSPGLDATLAQMHMQHLAHERGLEALLRALAEVQQHPHALAGRKALAASASALESDLEAHLGLEETALFPLIPRFLDPPTLAAAVAELRARRQP